MRKQIIIALAVLSGAFASGVTAQTSANRNGKLVIGGNGGIDLTNTLTFTTTGVFGSPQTFSFPVPSLGIFHSTAGGVLSLSLIDLNSTHVPADVTGILQPVNGGMGVNNGTQTLTLSGGFNITFATTALTSVTLPTSGILITSTTGVQYNLVGPQNTATVVGSTNYLLNVAYAASATTDAALGAKITSTAGTSGNNAATGLTLTTTAAGTAAAKGIVINTVSGTGTNIDITTPDAPTGDDLVIQPGASTTAATAGPPATLQGGTAGTTGMGGQLTLAGGLSGAAAGTGGSVVIRTAAAASGTTLADRLTISSSGNATLNTAGGSLAFTASAGGAATTTILAGNQSGSSFTYTLPIVAPNANQVLTSVSGGASSALSWTTPTTGTVTSVGLQMPAVLFSSVTNSPITSSGTLIPVLASQTANTVFAAPNGSAGTPTFRILTAADIPSLSGSYWSLSGNSGTTAYNGTTGNFIGTTDLQPLVLATTNTTTSQPIDFYTNNTAKMRLNAGGFLSLGGTFVPTSPLHIRNSNANSSVLYLENTAANGYTSMDMKNDAGTVGNVGVSNSGAGAFPGQFYFNISAGSVLPITFNQNTTEKMAVDLNGNFYVVNKLGVGFTNASGSNPYTNLQTAGRAFNVAGTAGTVNVRMTSLGAATPATTGGIVYADANGDINRLAVPATSGQHLSSSTSGTLAWASLPMLASGGVTPLSIVSGTTEYCAPMGQQTLTQNADVVGKSRMLVPKSGTVKNLFVSLSADPGNTNTRVFTLTKNGVATVVTCTVTGNPGGTSKTANDQTHSFTVAAGDEISLQVVSTKVGAANLVANDADWGFEIDTP